MITWSGLAVSSPAGSSWGDGRSGEPLRSTSRLARPAAGLVAFSAFTSGVDMAHRIVPFLPASLLLRHRFDSIRKISGITCPILIGHGRQDRIVPFEMGERLAEAARAPVTTLWIDEAEHNDFFDVAGRRLDEAMVRFIEGLPLPGSLTKLTKRHRPDLATVPISHAADADRMREALPQHVGHPAEDDVPLAEPGLPEDPHRGIPGAVLAVEHPPPLADGRERQPDRDAEPAREMGHGRVRGDDQVQQADERRGIDEVARPFARELDDREPAVQRGDLFQPIDRLNADEPHSREVGDGRQLGQRE